MGSAPKDSFLNSSESKCRTHDAPNGFPLKRRPADPTAADEGIPALDGWNLIGMIDHRGGIGNAARSNVQSLQKIVPTSRIISYPSGRITKAMDVPAIHGHNYLHWNPACVNMDRLRPCKWFRKATNIGYWAWETDEAPASWLPYDAEMDQIWVPSQFVKDALLKTTFRTPIYVIPHAIAPQSQHRYPPADKPITFLVQFDGHSRVERKRPDLSLKAITEAALRSKERVKIIVKSHHHDPNQLQLADYPNVEIQLEQGWMSESYMKKLWDEVDILVSMNRGEGFGLPLVEAMARGTAVVATFWGASKEYMTSHNSYPVPPFRIEHCAVANDAYFKTGNWAMPDVDTAIRQIILAMEEIRSGRIESIARNARLTADNFSEQSMTLKMKAALSELCSQ